MKSNPAEKPGVPKNEGLPRLMQDKVIMFFGAKPSRLDPQFPGHAQMNPNPAPNIFARPDFFGFAAGKYEQHLFAFGERTLEPLPH